MTDTTRSIVLAVSLALALSSLAAPAVAQENPINQTTTGPGDDATDVSDQLGDLVIHGYEYQNDPGVMVIEATWRGETPETVTLTEMIELDEGGSTEISFKQVRLLPESKTKIRISAEKRSSGTAAVMLTTPESVQENSALVLQAGDTKDRGEIPFQTANIFVALAALGGAGLAFAFTYRKHEDDSDVDRRDRIA